MLSCLDPRLLRQFRPNRMKYNNIAPKFSCMEPRLLRQYMPNHMKYNNIVLQEEVEFTNTSKLIYITSHDFRIRIGIISNINYFMNFWVVNTGGYSVFQRLFLDIQYFKGITSVLCKIFSTTQRYHQLSGGCSVLWEDTISSVGDWEYHQYYVGILLVLW